jgi:hypothetical protein
VTASEPLAPFVPGEHAAWLQPLPDSLLEVGDPAGAVIDRSSLRLAFAAAIRKSGPWPKIWASTPESLQAFAPTISAMKDSGGSLSFAASSTTEPLPEPVNERQHTQLRLL